MNPVLQQLNEMSRTIERGSRDIGAAKVDAAKMALQGEEYKLRRPGLELKSKEDAAKLEFRETPASVPSIFGDDMWGAAYGMSNERGKSSTIIDGIGKQLNASFVTGEGDPNQGRWVKKDGSMVTMGDIIDNPSVGKYLSAKLDPEKVYRDMAERGEEILLREGKNPEAVATANKLISNSETFFSDPDVMIAAFRKQRGLLNRLPGNHKADIAYIDKRVSEITAAKLEASTLKREELKDDAKIKRELEKEAEKNKIELLKLYTPESVKAYTDSRDLTVLVEKKEFKAANYSVEPVLGEDGYPTGERVIINTETGKQTPVTDSPALVAAKTKEHVDEISRLKEKERAEYLENVPAGEYKAVMTSLAKGHVDEIRRLAGKERAEYIQGIPEKEYEIVMAIIAKTAPSAPEPTRSQFRKKIDWSKFKKG